MNIIPKWQMQFARDICLTKLLNDFKIVNMSDDLCEVYGIKKRQDRSCKGVIFMDKLKDECLRSYLAEKKINIDYFMKMAGVIEYKSN